MDTTASALVGYERDQDVNGLSKFIFIDHYEGRVEYGTTFRITDTENGTLIDSNLAQGTYSNTSVERDIPTPQVAAILESDPEYGSFVDLDGNAGNEDIKHKDDAATVSLERNPGYAKPNNPTVPIGLVSDNTVTDPFSGNAMELFTGDLRFSSDAAFGIYHGPAVVSDEFRAEEGQFLRLNYTANGDVDDYHVSGYIFKIDEATGEYETDENGDAKLTMALNETGKTELNACLC